MEKKRKEKNEAKIGVGRECGCVWGWSWLIGQRQKCEIFNGQWKPLHWCEWNIRVKAKNYIKFARIKL